MKFNYFQRIKVYGDGPNQVLDGEISYENKEKSFRQEIERSKILHPGVAFSYMRAALEWEEKPWQNIYSVNSHHNPRFPWNILWGNDQNRRVPTKTYSVPCKICWVQPDRGYVPYVVFLNDNNAQEYMDAEKKGHNVLEPDKLTDGSLTIPVGVRLVGNGEHQCLLIEENSYPR